MTPPSSFTGSSGYGITIVQIYNAENRLSTVQLVMSGTCASPTTIPSQWDFVYDGDGNRVKQTYTDFTTSPYTVTISSYFMGGLYEVSDGAAVKKYYGIAGMMVAMSDGGGLASTAHAVEVAEARLRLRRFLSPKSDDVRSTLTRRIARLKIPAYRSFRFSCSCYGCKRSIAQPATIPAVWTGESRPGSDNADGFWVYRLTETT